MKQRSLTAATVLGHLAKALEEGYFVDYRRGKTIIYSVTCSANIRFTYSWLDRRIGRENHNYY